MLKIIINIFRCDNGIVVTLKKKSMLEMGEIMSQNCFKIIQPKKRGIGR